MGKYLEETIFQFFKSVPHILQSITAIVFCLDAGIYKRPAFIATNIVFLPEQLIYYRYAWHLLFK